MPKQGQLTEFGIFYKKHPNGHVTYMSQEKWDALCSRRTLRRSGPLKSIDCIATQLLENAKKRCKKRGQGKCTLTQEWIKYQLLAGCSVTGLDFEFDSFKRPNARTPSIDRIDSSNKDYTIENCRLVCFQVNCALNRFTERESLPILEAIVVSLKQKLDLHNEILL